MCLGSWAGATYLRYTELASPIKDETAFRCCDLDLSVLVTLVSPNVFHVVSTSKSTVCSYSFLTVQISCRSYVGNVFRIRSHAVSDFSNIEPAIYGLAILVCGHHLLTGVK